MTTTTTTEPCEDKDSDSVCGVEDSCAYDRDNDIDSDSICGDMMKLSISYFLITTSIIFTCHRAWSSRTFDAFLPQPTKVKKSC